MFCSLQGKYVAVLTDEARLSSAMEGFWDEGRYRPMTSPAIVLANGWLTRQLGKVKLTSSPGGWLQAKVSGEWKVCTVSFELFLILEVCPPNSLLMCGCLAAPHST
jgi:hypothetical protein